MPSNALFTSELTSTNARALVLLLERDAATFDRLAASIACDPALELVAASADPSSLLELAARIQPDVALINSRIERSGSAAMVRRLREACPRVRCIALSSGDDAAEVAEMLAAGAVGYVDALAPGPTITGVIHELGALKRDLGVDVSAPVLAQSFEPIDGDRPGVRVADTQARMRATGAPNAARGCSLPQG